MSAEPQRPATVERYRRAMEGLVGVPATEGNTVEVLRNGDRIFPAMLAAIRDAGETIDFATYVYWTGDIAVEFARALSERARDGVRVRILLDAVGAYTMDRSLVDDMVAAGSEVEFFRPPTVKLWETNHRTHRKVLVCDEEVAFTGGVGIAEEWCGDARNPDEWRETHVRLRGPAVDGLRAAFVSNWAETGHPLFDGRDRFPQQPQPGDVTVQVVKAPSQNGWSDMGTAVSALILLARHRLRITTAYFVPDERFVRLLSGAVARGVDVDVLVPGPYADKRIVQLAGEERYDELLEAGVRIHRYQPTMLHAKVLTVDGVVSMIGSANFDQRSLGINEESNVVLFDASTTAVFDADFEHDLERSELVTPGQWQERSAPQKVAEKVTRLFDEQL